MSTPRADQLPKALTSLPNWVGWRTENRDGSDRPTKVPYRLNTNGRIKARSNCSGDWAPFPSAIPDWLDGAGIVFTKEAGITGIDLDDCIDPVTKFIKPWALGIRDSFKYTYFETSPSGTGIKIFCFAALPGAGRKVFVDADGNPTVESMADGAIEMYDTGRYFAVTGRALGPLEISACQSQADHLYRHLRGVVAAPEPGDSEVLTEGARHNYLLTVAGRLRNQGFDREAMVAAIRPLNLSKCSPPKPDRELIGIVDFLMGKPAKYKLMPADMVATADGHVLEMPQPAVEPEDVGAPPPDTSSVLAYAESVFAAALATKKPEEVLGAVVINALAQAGSIKQFEAKRRIKEAKINISLREFDALIKAAEMAARPALGESSFLLTAEGSMQTNLANAKVMLEPIPLRYNSFTCRAFLTADSPWGTSGNWTDYDDAQATVWCQRKDLNVIQNVVATAADTLARSRPHYHPVQEYLKSLKWDGTFRLSEWLINYMGAEDTEYVRQVGRKWMIQAVKRALEPGCQADYTLVPEGMQGKLKSSLLRTLCGNDWFSDDIGDMGGKDAAMQLQGKWIVELAELDAFRRAEMTTIKAWLVRRYDHIRPPYGRRAEDFPRQNVFAATTNKTDWLQDDTGGRRFWPVKVIGNIDIEGVAKNRDQLWAEAMFAYSEGEKSYLSESIELLAKEEQHERQDLDPWTDNVKAWIAAPSGAPGLDSDRDRVYLQEVLQYCLGLATKDWTNQHKARVTRILKIAGYIVKRASRVIDGKRPEYWVKAVLC